MSVFNDKASSGSEWLRTTPVMVEKASAEARLTHLLLLSLLLARRIPPTAICVIVVAAAVRCVVVVVGMVVVVAAVARCVASVASKLLSSASRHVLRRVLCVSPSSPSSSPSSSWLLFAVASVFASLSLLSSWSRCASHLAFAAQAMQSDLRCQWWGGGGTGWQLDRLGSAKSLMLMMSLLFVVLAPLHALPTATSPANAVAPTTTMVATAATAITTPQQGDINCHNTWAIVDSKAQWQCQWQRQRQQQDRRWRPTMVTDDDNDNDDDGYDYDYDYVTRQ
ncbi:hypothetical protein EDB89DRAFT_1916391 [Lactarius sanguifluus]|nr:hypothetical protein EDB89DRAFT_1916391 [Lactarius sanguifluus]